MSPEEFLANAKKVVSSIYAQYGGPPQSFALATTMEDKDTQTDASLGIAIPPSVFEENMAWHQEPQDFLQCDYAIETPPLEPLSMQVDQVETQNPMEYEQPPTYETLQPAAPITQPLSAYNSRCYRCSDICMHNCHKCKTPCHGSVRGCSKAVDGEEAIFDCFLCFESTIVEEPGESQPAVPIVPIVPIVPKTAMKTIPCPDCNLLFSTNYNLRRHKKNSCHPKTS